MTCQHSISVYLLVVVVVFVVCVVVVVVLVVVLYTARLEPNVLLINC